MMDLPVSHLRRQWLRFAAVGTAAAAVPASWPLQHALASESSDACVTESGFSRPLFVPGNEGRLGRLVVGSDKVILRAAAHADGFAFDASIGTRSYSNPTLVAASGGQVQVDLVNALGEPTVAHWHGLSIDTRNDGNGEALVAPGERFHYAFTIRNRAGLYWYHPHPHGATARQTYLGLFGLLEIEDDEERSLRRALDIVPGVTELALVLQDRRSGDGDRYAPAPEDELLGWYGCRPHVNGVLRPFHEVAPRRYRLRVLNASNARTFRLAFRRDNGTELSFLLIGTDGGLLERAVRCNELLLSPAERVDLLVDFAAEAQGGFVVMESRAFAPMQDVPRTQVQAESQHGHRSAPGFVADGAAFDIMQFRIRGPGGAAPAIPTTLSRWPAMPDVAGDDRPLRLGIAKNRWRINDRVYDAQSTPIEVARGAREIWLLRNYHTSAPHAMHLHGFQFRVVARETSPEQVAQLAIDAHGRLPTDVGFKDTVLVWPGESVRIAVDFRLPFGDSQIYLVHCHNLEHEDQGMMLRFRVG